MTVHTDYYELLGVQRGADDRAIKAAYRKLAMECHPDRHGGCPEQEAKFKQLNEAYDCLKDPQKRAAYDRFGHAAFQNGGQGGFGGGPGPDFSDIFSSIFGEFMDPRGARQNAARGADLRYDLELTLEESFAGKSATIDIETMARCEPCEGDGARGASQPVTCKTCGGAGKVRAQQGFFVVERGCPTCYGHGVTIADPLYQRDGTTLVAECPVSFTTAALGGSIHVPGIDGEKIEVKIPPGIQSGETLRLRGKGMAVLNGRGRGDLVARILVETPTRLSAKQKELLCQFRETETGEECPASRSFFARIKDVLG
jgi:molecular chaperone DnaJ